MSTKELNGLYNKGQGRAGGAAEVQGQLSTQDPKSLSCLHPSRTGVSYLVADAAFGKRTALPFQLPGGECMADPSSRASPRKGCGLVLVIGLTQDQLTEVDCQPHAGNGERSSFPVKGGKVCWKRGEGDAGQSKQLMSNLACLRLISEGHSDYVLGFCAGKMLSFLCVRISIDNQR